MSPSTKQHCVICGAVDYPMSMGGPTICPKCDCGQFDAATVISQQKRIIALLDRIAVLEQVNSDPDGRYIWSRLITDLPESDLVKRLKNYPRLMFVRRKVGIDYYVRDLYMKDLLTCEAADRIAVLEGALKEIANKHIGDPPASVHYTESEWVWKHITDVRRTARAAINDKVDNEKAK